MNKIQFLMLMTLFAGCTTTQRPIVTGGAKTDTSNTISKPDNISTQNDIFGIYHGVLPCADCEGIQTEIRLNKDTTYQLFTKYIGKDSLVSKSEGKFVWDSNEKKIILNDKENPRLREANRFIVGENLITKLDLNGNKIEGQNAEKYILKKDNNDITEKYWKLIEVNGQPVVALPNQRKEAHFILKVKDSMINAHGGCNAIVGFYQVTEGSRIRFFKVAASMADCNDMEVERNFIKTLETADNYSVKDDTLSLNKARMAPLAKFKLVYFR